MNQPDAVTHRGMAMLRAVAAGRVEATCSCEPDLRVDGLLCSDQATSHQLVRAGYIRLSGGRRPWTWVPAELTAAGRLLLGMPAAAAEPVAEAA
ncbi:hypothetical protein FKR81_19895 [Lentzea tibetensis]|uniref:ArsR family transcriptional regulator n=1 Tax=Lentzea tibetensis TaxID=2591470 RepID=A0A563ES75_9PSEU|nr:hypothetical protein [Lentzea tibetensis]TWP50442.1 hypothetical protein FKR81_19895 [Lentzea tibetensis]